MENNNADMIYGRNPVTEALDSGIGIEKILIQKNIEGAGKKVFALAKKKGIPVQAVDKRVLDRIVGTGSHQGVAAYIASYAYKTIEDILEIAATSGEHPFIVVLDGIEDPHNLGAIIRSAEGAGAHGIIIAKNRAAGVNETVIKTSAGAALYMAVARVSGIPAALETLKDAGVWIYGLDMDGETYYDRAAEGSAAIVIGSEGKGISRLVREKCDFVLSIPMQGRINSLNASNAAAILLYEIRKQRNQTK